MKKFVSLFILSLIFSFSYVSIINTQSASALSGSSFTAGRIIDDGTFFNPNSMNTGDIQNFLNAKVPTCDTNGTQTHSSGMTRAAYGATRGNPAPYTCLRNYSQTTTTKSPDAYCAGHTSGFKTSAQIIYEVAQSCGVSPKVLLVLLQKEQSLITDDWPWAIQYRSATGYGCPDTAPCDAQYYGFFNQVYAAARVFKYYSANTTNYNYRAGRNNYIQYNPNTACGGANVYIQNQATAGLYVYTPYQPNAAALNNLYGSGDSCSAYGNRNFWRIYNDWFGNPVGNGYEFVDAINPTPQVNPNDVVNARIRIRNTSGTTWYGDGNVPSGQHAFRLATVSYESTPYGNPSDPNWLGTNNQIKMQESSVPNGQIATFNFTFRAPLRLVNNHWTRFAPVYDGANFLPYIGLSFTTFTPTPNFSYQVTGSSGITNNMPTNYTAPVSYTLLNSGNVVWFNDASKPAGTFPLRILTAEPFYHSSVFYDSSTWLANNQIGIADGRISPGQSTTVGFNLKTPSLGGNYNEQFGLVLDGALAYPDTSQMRLGIEVSNYKYSVVSNDIPTSLVAGQKFDATIRLRNTGGATWYADGSTPTDVHAIRLMTEGYRRNLLSDLTGSSWIGGGNQVTMTTASVAPGAIGEFNIKLLAPYNLSGFNSSFKLVLDGVYIVPDAIQRNTSIPAIAPSYTQQPGGIHPSPTPVSKNGTTTGKLIVKNTSNFVWYNDTSKPAQISGGAVRMVMSYPYYRNSSFADPSDMSWLGTKNQIKMTTGVVNPGENATFDFNWKAPPTTGRYAERFTLALDGYQLFPDIGMELVSIVQ